MSQALNNAAALRRQLMQYLPMRAHDPHTNPAKLLAYRLSDELAAGRLSLAEMENILADLCQTAARDRGKRLADRAGMGEIESWRRQFNKIIRQKAKGGFSAFRKWAESEAIGLVATAHPTFAMTD
ncbi:hypothetical protein N9X51_06775, partial [Alphaproteobacteria bacterium]|nr:hypothetical protein [Alphaproteobacteria bacterium]